jgi:hypothetical protein
VGTDTRRPAARRKQRTMRVLLIGLSPAREKLLIDEPELVSTIVRERLKTAIPRSVEFDERCIELQRSLFDFAWKTGASEACAEALTPRGGTLIYEDETIDAARLVRTEQASVVAQWMADLPGDLIQIVRRYEQRSPVSRSYPDNLGSVPAPEAEQLREGVSVRPGSGARPAATELESELARLRSFYAELAKSKGALLAVRFRE